MNPPERKCLLVSHGEWISHAESDLKLAILGRAHEDILYEQVCFHAQQAVEKALKAVLIFCSLDFPLTHDVEELLELAEQGNIDLPSELGSAGLLTPYAVETRYPGSWEEISKADVDEAIALAKSAIHWAKTFPQSENP